MDIDFKHFHNAKFLLIRSSIMVVHGVTFAISQFYLPLPIVHTIGSASPLFVFILDFYMYGITINKKQTLGIVVSLIGTLLTVNGPYMMKIFDATY
jgi:drug/metabolite transporter (DMT)-like permease